MNARAHFGAMAVITLGFIVVGLASATHSPDTRFTVLGFVRDHAGSPMRDRPVQVVRERTGLAFRGKSDGAGFYVVVVWVRDEDRGDRLRVETGGASLVVLAMFDPSDRKTERGTRVDFTGSHAVERREAFRATLDRWLSQ